MSRDGEVVFQIVSLSLCMSLRTVWHVPTCKRNNFSNNILIWFLAKSWWVLYTLLGVTCEGRRSMCNDVNPGLTFICLSKCCQNKSTLSKAGRFQGAVSWESLGQMAPHLDHCPFPEPPMKHTKFQGNPRNLMDFRALRMVELYT